MVFRVNRRQSRSTTFRIKVQIKVWSYFEHHVGLCNFVPRHHDHNRIVSKDGFTVATRTELSRILYDFIYSKSHYGGLNLVTTTGNRACRLCRRILLKLTPTGFIRRWMWRASYKLKSQQNISKYSPTHCFMCGPLKACRLGCYTRIAPHWLQPFIKNVLKLLFIVLDVLCAVLCEFSTSVLVI